MLFTEMILVALQSVRANLFRAILTMLGIIIGVASVITMVAIGAGARAAVDQQIEALGASVLSVRAGSMFRMGVAQSGQNLEIEDAEAIARDATTITDVVPEMSQQIQVKLGNTNRNLRVVGVTPNFADVNGFEIDRGSPFTMPTQLNTTARDILGQTIYVRGIAFKVVGVLAEKGSTGFRNVDEQVWIPLSTARYRVFGTKTLDVISAKVAPGVPVERAMVDVERIMRREHQILPGKDNDFSVSDPRQFFNVREAAANIFSVLLASIASISLVVGGIGIMNIMLVTVTERTREIGIRKALGATRFHILLQFVVEAMVLCMLGGLVGVALGAGIATLIARILGWSVAVSPMAIVMAFSFSAAVGLFFGIWPARKAAMLDPIEALRYE
jgi:putative ABC transport system permease protein